MSSSRRPKKLVGGATCRPRNFSSAVAAPIPLATATRGGLPAAIHLLKFTERGRMRGLLIEHEHGIILFVGRRNLLTRTPSQRLEQGKKNPSSAASHSVVGETPNGELSPDPELGKIFFIRRGLLRWRKAAGRTFWWRGERNPYRIALVEILLRQTRATATVERDIAQFVSKYHSPDLLAQAPPTTLIRNLEPFGLHRQRAKQLQALGKHLSQRENRVPRSEKELLKLPGIGPYAASAIRCFSFGACEPVVDVNVARIIQRVFGIRIVRGEPRRNKEIWRIARQIVQKRYPREINWGLLDLGALVCTPRSPKCEICPLNCVCRWAQENRCIT